MPILRECPVTQVTGRCACGRVNRRMGESEMPTGWALRGSGVFSQSADYNEDEIC
jgi:hypothetical protein